MGTSSTEPLVRRREGLGKIKAILCSRRLGTEGCSFTRQRGPYTHHPGGLAASNIRNKASAGRWLVIHSAVDLPPYFVRSGRFLTMSLPLNGPVPLS